MYLKQQFLILKKFIRLFVVVVILATLFSFLFVKLKPTTYASSASFAVNRVPEQNTTDYKYDGYYALQSNLLFAKQFVEWLGSPIITNAIFKKAEEEGAETSFTRKLSVTNSSPQSIEVRFKNTDKETAETLARSALSVVEERKNEFTGASYSSEAVLGTVNAVSSNPVTSPLKPQVFLSTAVGFVLGLILGAIVVYLANIFSSIKKEE